MLIKKQATVLSRLQHTAEVIRDTKQLTHDTNLNFIRPKVKQSNEVNNGSW